MGILCYYFVFLLVSTNAVWAMDLWLAAQLHRAVHDQEESVVKLLLDSHAIDVGMQFLAEIRFFIQLLEMAIVPLRGFYWIVVHE